jgi:hypothetical protein
MASSAAWPIFLASASTEPISIALSAATTEGSIVCRLDSSKGCTLRRTVQSNQGFKEISVSYFLGFRALGSHRQSLLEDSTDLIFIFLLHPFLEPEWRHPY